MAMNAADARAIRDAVREAGVQLQMGFKFRYAPMVRRAREFLPHPRVVVGQVMDNPWPEGSWATDPVKGGGNVISQGCHNFDLVCFLANAEPVELRPAPTRDRRGRSRQPRPGCDESGAVGRPWFPARIPVLSF